MKLRGSLLVIALLLTTPVSAISFSSGEQKRERLLFPTDSFNRTTENPLDRAYLDVRALLRQDGSCGEFFGGHASERVLEKLVLVLNERRIGDVRISVSMYGRFTSFADVEGISYRLFAIAELNTQGPFYKSKVFPAEPSIPNVGSFKPNTREARVLILLHELAHLIRGKDGLWLIPDDGHDPHQSRQNTIQVEAQCGKQIRNLE